MEASRPDPIAPRRQAGIATGIHPAGELDRLRMGKTVVAVSQQIAERAAEIRAQHDRLRLPDAIVLATARELRADLLTYDDTLTSIAAQT